MCKHTVTVLSCCCNWLVVSAQIKKFEKHMEKKKSLKGLSDEEKFVYEVSILNCSTLSGCEYTTHQCTILYTYCTQVLLGMPLTTCSYIRTYMYVRMICTYVFICVHTHYCINTLLYKS